MGKERISDRCPYCFSKLISKPKMAHEILKMINYPEEKSIYNSGVFTRGEMYAIYRYIVRASKKRRGS